MRRRVYVADTNNHVIRGVDMDSQAVFTVAGTIRSVQSYGAFVDIGAATDALLARGNEYSVVWDLRDSPTPGLRDTMRLARWGLANKAELERLTVKMGVIVPDGAVASIAGGLLGAFSAVDTVISSDADEVEAQM